VKETDTIAAISTPVGEGGIGIVRVSGPEAFLLAEKVSAPRGSGRGRLLPTGSTTVTSWMPEGRSLTRF